MTDTITLDGHTFPAPPRKPERDAGDYYDNKAAAARHWRQQLQLETDPERRRICQGRIAMAEYVGD